MSPPGGIFVNCSNHAVATWPAAQREAAEAMGHGPPVDLGPGGGFPAVPMGADADEIARMADETAARIVRLGAAVAFVTGEHTLTCAIVARLQAVGVRCVNSRAERIARERILPDGSTQKVSRFVFRGWRDYPSLVR